MELRHLRAFVAIVEVTTFARRTYAGRDFARRAPPLPPPRLDTV